MQHFCSVAFVRQHSALAAPRLVEDKRRLRRSLPKWQSVEQPQHRLCIQRRALLPSRRPRQQTRQPRHLFRSQPAFPARSSAIRGATTSMQSVDVSSPRLQPTSAHISTALQTSRMDRGTSSSATTTPTARAAAGAAPVRVMKEIGISCISTKLCLSTFRLPALPSYYLSNHLVHWAGSS